MKAVMKIATAAILTSTLSFAATLATVNGTKITDEDVTNALMQATQGRLAQLPAQKQEQLRKQFLDELVAKELIYNDAKKEGITNSKEYKEQLDKIIANIKKDLAIKIWQKKVFDGIKISDKELKNYYNQNKQEFMQKESVHARHILVKTEKEAKDIINQLKGLKGAALQNKFIELAKTKSTGPSGPRGGDLGYFGKGQMVPEFEKAAFSMKPGTITKQPIKTQFGYHVIYVEDKKPATTRSFDEVKPYIEQRLKMEKFKQVMQDKLSSLKNKAKISYSK
ncbi:MAG: peptidylprolyl isomerase [Epsilonproteobacteria bacterium]|nr:peptidylprolyl isomerase [Campylobacterota bacterium]